MYLIYITCKDFEEAKEISNVLLKEKLVACTNIIDKIFSSFWWKGNLESCNESLIIAKTSDSKVDEVIKRVKELHSYEVPDILAIKIEKYNKEFNEWLMKEVK